MGRHSQVKISVKTITKPQAMPKLPSCGIIHRWLFLKEGRKGGLPEEGSAFFSCENPITIPAAGQQKHTRKPWSSPAFFGLHWLTTPSARERDVPAQTSLCLGAVDPMGGSCFSVVKKKLQKIYLPPSNSFSQVSLLSLQNRIWHVDCTWRLQETVKSYYWKIILLGLLT